jgi:hypothetical protein
VQSKTNKSKVKPKIKEEKLLNLKYSEKEGKSQ